VQRTGHLQEESAGISIFPDEVSPPEAANPIRPFTTSSFAEANYGVNEFQFAVIDLSLDRVIIFLNRIFFIMPIFHTAQQ
jgi:hypothetical protein